MSGGVDSSVAAALLVEQGYQVIGIMLRLWSEPGKNQVNRCCSPEAMAQAKRVSAQYFIDGYTQGITPNPCLRCNRHIRWEFLLNHALAFGSEFMATGHFARLRQDDSRILLLKAIDQEKDQSYVLHVLNQDQLSKAVFPIGEYSKPEVRQLARDFNLPVSERPESQDLCFIGNGDYRDFLDRNSQQEANDGLILNSKGETLGTHHGLANYTIGQRRGLGISSPVPMYVLDKDSTSNSLIIGEREKLGRNRLWAENVNWVSIDTPANPINAQVKIRYKSSDEPASIIPIDGDRVKVNFERHLNGITPGQAAVFYQEDICLGGGIIYASE
jgi:tRNA-specific 2-thiouridylase